MPDDATLPIRTRPDPLPSPLEQLAATPEEEISELLCEVLK
jgi:hypothetical protein